MNTISIYKHDLERRKVDIVIQIEYSLSIGLFDMVCSDQTLITSTTIHLVGFRFQLDYKPNQNSTKPNFQNRFGSVGLIG